jgi:hypothetical protein
MRAPFDAPRRRRVRRRRLWALLVLVVVLAIAWWRFGYMLVTVDAEDRLAAAAAGTTFDFANVAGPAWDQVVLLGPYTDRAAAEAALGHAWPEYGLVGLESSDSWFLVVFSRRGHVVAFDRIPRCNPDFDKNTLARRYAPAEARFRVLMRGTCKMLVPTP